MSKRMRSINGLVASDGLGNIKAFLLIWMIVVMPIHPLSIPVIRQGLERAEAYTEYIMWHLSIRFLYAF